MQSGLIIAFNKNRKKLAAAAAFAAFTISSVAFAAAAGTPPAPAGHKAVTGNIIGAEAAFHVPAGEYALDKNHANVLWSVTHFGLSHYYGRFDIINAVLKLDAEDITRSTLHVEIDPKSVSTNHTARPNSFNEKIAGPKILDSGQFPLIRFDSTKITLTGAKTGKVDGNLTLHGITRPVSLDVRFNNFMNPQPKMKAPGLGFSAITAFKRSDFGLAMLQPRVSDEVKVTIEAEFYHKSIHDAAVKKAEKAKAASTGEKEKQG